MAWVEKDLKDHLISTPLLCAGSPPIRPGCPEPHPDEKIKTENQQTDGRRGDSVMSHMKSM